MNKLIATTLENKVHLWDLREQHPKEGFASHSYAHDSSENGKSTTIWAATHLPQNRDIWATCGGNGSVHIWKYNYPTSRFEELTTEKGTKERRGVIGNGSVHIWKYNYPTSRFEELTTEKGTKER